MAAGTTPRSKRRKVWPDDAIALPTRDGQDVGGAQERTMLALAGGAAGIRTVEEINPDGSITRLRTRQGRPTFETDTVRATSGSGDIQLRGFVAQIPGRRAVLFNPYTLEVIKTPYTPAAKLYEVQDFMTETTWYDVVLFDGTTIKVNAKAMPRLGITANHGYEAIPHVINYTVGDQYGNAERNTTEKRVFAVGRYSVTSWGGGGVTETLTPTEPRTELRALTIGQRIDGDTAYLGELYHGADGWDGATEWYFRTAAVQMLLTAAYLVKTSVGANVAMTAPTMASAGTSSGTMNTDTTLPVTGVGLQGSPVLNLRVAYDGHALPVTSIVWPWSSAVQKPLAGSVDATYSREAYGSISPTTDTVSVAGQTLTYSGVNVKNFDTRNESTRVKDQLVALSDDPTLVSPMTSVSTSGDTLIWGDTDTGYGPGDVEGHIKTGGKYYTPWNGVLPGSSVTGRAYQTQTGDFSIVMGAVTLVDLHFWREQSSGSKAALTGRTDFYAGYLANPYGFIGVGSGIGIGNTLTLVARTYPGNDDATPVLWYKATGDVSTRYQPPEAIAEVNAFVDALAAAYLSIPYFDSENNSGYANPNLYYVSVSPSVTLDNNTLTWSTKDFILYDPTNEVYITIEGDFVGTDNVATLTVLLKVQTRHHTTTQTLGTFNYTYTEMLVEREIGTSGKYAVPSPQIRAIFAPLYCEQGSFKGAHYVTQAEEDGGIAAFHGFNFVLNLRMYSDFDTCNDDNDGQQVYFVPCNLMEMLYAFVFSTEYGVAEGGTRYPVTYTSRFNEMRDTLFATPVRVSVKNGSATNWTDSLGGDFAAVGTVALYRT